ncbi:MAG: response regulator [Desulfohalobiaceae bacterium]|nr:response regulator [Desulfohalobiaceae bacterium]
MNDTCRILVLDDEPIVGDRLKTLLEKDGHQVAVFHDPNRAVEHLEKTTFEIVISDIRMREMDGIQVMNLVFRKSPGTKVILITGYATLELAREALTKGAFDFIAKPFKSKEIRRTIDKAADALRHAEQQNVESERA